MVSELPYASGAFDNWQAKISKLWQDGSKSSLMQRGTAFLMKRNKCCDLPIGTTMKSPS
eukprot:CAMPEP_0172534938 /NCGR_PEP_ID=MMETSP1067-20121228/7144_1 /TAXON_ID=265564 ORGANISM="Thalassiosira punctigera, Strain Tpunct2005C2" /NCGR_SAMPLE_ID=MMETSP1067 /ASSEMBLY_ACC=CAM_ASM_000444 /LENGTH=58 /DNA_ID=CAMNT_0013319811 /DNA_START=182 /DNA_END=354 /DNA_ORIENTATION=-